MMINLDGEYGGDAPLKLINLKNHITFFADTDLISNDAYSVIADEPEIEEIAQKFAHEVEDLEGELGE
ncbi:putative lipid kinase [Streptococcus parauberis]|nr:putative lipid kinase [Streptococcus parauberis]